jgi:hypothetical protein
VTGRGAWQWTYAGGTRTAVGRIDSKLLLDDRYQIYDVNEKKIDFAFRALKKCCWREHCVAMCRYVKRIEKHYC